MRRKNSFLDILKSMISGLGQLLLGLLRLLLKILITFGLWLPGLYAVLGLILYKGVHFDPFDFSVYSVVYLSGGVACVVCAVIITLRNVIVNPVKSVIDKKRDKKNDAWAEEEARAREEAEKEKQKKEEEKYSPPDYDEIPLFSKEEPEDSKKEEEGELPPYLITDEDFAEEKSASEMLFSEKEWRPVKKTPNAEPVVVSAPKKEIPEVYFSTLDPSVLVHEYSDRFELYRVTGNKTKFIGIENKT